MVVLRPLHHIFAAFNNFNDTQVMGMAPEALGGKSFYNHVKHVRFYPPHGLNSGAVRVARAAVMPVLS